MEKKQNKTLRPGFLDPPPNLDSTDCVRNGPNPQSTGIWGRGGAASRIRVPERPAPAPRTRSGHSRFLHGLPPLATGVGDVGAAAVHGAQAPAAPPRARAQTAGSPGPGCGWDDCSSRSPIPRSRARPTCVLPQRWEDAASSKPRVPQPRASRCAARACIRGARGGDRLARQRRCSLYPRWRRGAGRHRR